MEAVHSENAAAVVDHAQAYIQLCEENQAWIRDEAKPYILDGFELVGNHRNDGALAMLAMRKSEEELVFYFNVDQLSLEDLRNRSIDPTTADQMADEADHFFSEVVEANMNDRRRISITGGAWGGTIANYLATKHNVPAIAFDAYPLPTVLLENLEQLHVTEERQVSYNFQKNANNMGAWSAIARNPPTQPAITVGTAIATAATEPPSPIGTTPAARASSAPVIALAAEDPRPATPAPAAHLADVQGFDIVVDRTVAPAFNAIFNRIDDMEIRQRTRAIRALTRVAAAPDNELDGDQSFDPASSDQAELNRRASADPAGSAVVSAANPEPPTSAPQNTFLAPELPTVSAAAPATSPSATGPVDVPVTPVLIPTPVELGSSGPDIVDTSDTPDTPDLPPTVVDDPVVLSDVDSNPVPGGEKSETDEEGSPEEGPADFTSLSSDHILVTSLRDKDGRIRPFRLQGFHEPPDLDSRARGEYVGPAQAIRQEIDTGSISSMEGTARFEADLGARSILGGMNFSAPDGDLSINIPTTGFDGTFNGGASGSDGSVGTASGRTFGSGGTQLGATASIGNANSRTEAVTVSQWRPIGSAPAAPVIETEPDTDPVPTVTPEPLQPIPVRQMEIFGAHDNTFTFMHLEPSSIPIDAQFLGPGVGQPQIIGQMTPYASIPNSGKADYVGVVRAGLVGAGAPPQVVGGKIYLEADFNSRNVSGIISDLGPIQQLNVNMTYAANHLTGTVSGSGFSGNISGHLYGPTADEAGGSLSASSQTQQLQGGWATRRTTPLPVQSTPAPTSP